MTTRRLARNALCVCVCLLACARGAASQTPDEGTVFVRVIGDIRATREQDALLLKERGLDLTNMEVATGSGFFFSPLGYILTNHHVISNRVRMAATLDRRTIEVSVVVRRIEVLFPDTPGDARPGTRAPQEASVVGSSADLDLAVLHVGGGDHPFLRFGDSDTLEQGQAVEVIGFPFGRKVELDTRAASSSAAPQASVSHGNVSAIRADAQQQPRYVQTTATLNPGNSGGPMLDDEGYVIGIISRALVQGDVATGVGFAIPVNLVKGFLEALGLDGFLTVRRLVLGPVHRLESKGLHLRLPDGLTDLSPLRAFVDSGSDGVDGLALRIDRIVSPWPASRLAEALTTGRAFEPVIVSKVVPHAVRPADADARQLVTGWAAGTQADGRTPARLEYCVVDLGREKLVARYVGRPDLIAFNASVLRASLESLDGEPLATGRQDLSASHAWAVAEGTDGRASALARLALPKGWLQEPGAPLPCAGLGTPLDTVSASPSWDFTTVLRAARFRQAGVTPESAATACGTSVRTDGAGRYQKRLEGFGTTFVVEGTFLSIGSNELLQLEAMAIAQRAAPIRPLLAQWIEQITGR